jgi:cytochrome b involved in lipid metabolism
MRWLLLDTTNILATVDRAKDMMLLPLLTSNGSVLRSKALSFASGSLLVSRRLEGTRSSSSWRSKWHPAPAKRAIYPLSPILRLDNPPRKYFGVAVISGVFFFTLCARNGSEYDQVTEHANNSITLCHDASSSSFSNKSVSATTTRRNKFEQFLQKATIRGASIDVAKLPVYSMEEVAKHNGDTTRTTTAIWMSYGGYVLDVTAFLPLHPGGTERISRAAGAALEPYWYLHQQHFETTVPLEILQGLVVGRLREEDQEKVDAMVSQMEDQWDRFQLEIEIEGGGVDDGDHNNPNSKVCYSLADLKRLPKTDQTSQVGCSQNADRRPVSASLFGGVQLKELLPFKFGKNGDQTLRITFCAMDGETHTIELNNTDDQHYKEILVCYEMNGAPLTKKRGFPLRVIIPGKRVVKWVHKIQVESKAKQ